MNGRRLRMGTGALLAFAFLGAGCKATPRGKWETAAVTRAKHWIFVRNKDAKNPLQATPENVADGKANFSHYCIACHGLDGQNTGVQMCIRDRCIREIVDPDGSDSLVVDIEWS